MSHRFFRDKLYYYMKRVVNRVVVALMALTVAATVSASTNEATAILRNIQQRFTGAENYRVTFTMSIAGHTTEGVLHVDKYKSYVRNGNNEIYIADGVRREVNTAKREIVVDKMLAMGGDMLGNPARGIDGLLSDFDATLTTYDGQRALRLMAKGGKREEEAAYIVLAEGDRMDCIVFGNGESRVTIKAVSVERNVGAALAFDAARYEGFETMDFR